MRKQIAAANWKMNLTVQQAEQLLKDITDAEVHLEGGRMAVFAVPFPYLLMAEKKLAAFPNYFVAAQNCSDKKSGAYTGEVSVDMLKSIDVTYCIIGHSERREYFKESNQSLADKIDLCIGQGITPVFCCGEPLPVREASSQNSYVETQLKESLFHLDAEDLKKVVIAYEPIWAIGTGKTASTEQAQEMHAFIRSVLAAQYKNKTAEEISILYGGSVKASNAAELFNCPDVDGGLVGGASLVSADFIQIIKALKQ